MTRLVSIAIPDSLFIDEGSLRGKTQKSGEIVRAAAIFGVERIYIYRDASSNFDKDYEIARQIFEYAEIPQYLRKRLIEKKGELEFAGLLPPLRIPHHTKEARVQLGEVREAVLLMQNGRLCADVGAKEYADYEGHGQSGQRVTVKLDCLNPFKAVQSPRPEELYWGYEVRRAPSLARFLRSANFDLTILTSRLGENIGKKWQELISRFPLVKRTLVCFGSPDSGVDYMLKQDHQSVFDFPRVMYLNTFPTQHVATVRLEEAILGTLSILNLAASLGS